MTSVMENVCLGCRVLYGALPRSVMIDHHGAAPLNARLERSILRVLRTRKTGLRLLDRIKREKGVWWMPRQSEAMKDVITCDKLWGAGNRL